MSIQSVKSQLARNSIALVSICIALYSLGYNTWRNEKSEHNTNVRDASFEVLSKLGQLKELVYLGHYDHDQQRGNPRIGWSYVLSIGDLSLVLPETVQHDAAELSKVWGDNWEGIGADQASVDNIDQVIDTTRDHVIQLVKSLH